MTFPNFFLEPTAYSRVRIGGILVRSVLVEVDGIKLEADWNEQRPTGQSGATWVFRGMKPPGPHKLTFEVNYSWAEASAALKVALGRITAEVFSGSG